jgi:cytochrome bd-type quinol oxidase subunit 2
MNKKGQDAIVGVGGFIMLFIAVIVGLILLQGSAQNLDNTLNTVTLANQSISTVVNGTPQYLTNVKSLSDVVIYNATGDVIVGSGNYTIENNVIYNGQPAVKITPDASAAYKSAWKVSGTGQPLEYADSTSRSIIPLIIVMMALAIAAVAIGYAVRSYKE